MDYEILKELKTRLNGKCQMDIRTCPAEIAREYGEFVPTNRHIEIRAYCIWCEKEFGWLYDEHEYIHFGYDKRYPCPCILARDQYEIIQHLDDIIEEMEAE